MANKKDLIDAQTFTRKRLLTAFTSGAPGGKELEPASPWKPLIAGVSLALIVVLVALVYGFVKPGLPNQWDNNTLVLVRDNGARYLAVDGTLYPVLNGTSARLLMPADSFKVVTTDSAAIADVPVGPAIGILGAPDDVPNVEDLIPTAWTACVVPDGTAVSLPGEESAAVTDTGALVTQGGELYVIADGMRYPVSTEDEDAVLREVFGETPVAIEVDSRWLNLFAAGSTLEPVVVADAGEPLGETEFAVGSVLHPQGSTNRFLVTPEGELAPMSPLAYQLYLLGSGVLLGGEREVTPGEIAFLPTADERAGGDDWPTDPLTPTPPDLTLCAMLTHDAQGEPGTQLATASAAIEAPGVRVALRHGALVAAGGSTDQSLRAIQIIDESGTAFAVPGATADLLARLGYTPEDVSAVGSAWLQFFAAGPELTEAAAGATPSGTVITSSSASPVPSPSPAPPAESPAVEGAAASPSPSVATTAQASLDAVVNDVCTPGEVVYSSDLPTALNVLQAQSAWSYATGDGVVIAVVDSGIDASNAHLTEVVTGGINLVGDGERADGMSDTYGHGTAVAGIIAAQLVPDSGVVGLAPNATLLSVRVLRDDSDQAAEAGFGPTAPRVAEGIVWAVDHGADIINASLSMVQDFPEVRAAVDYAAAHDVLIVASAGNRTTADDVADSPRYPAAYAAPLSVAATTNAGLVTDSSIHGPHVEIAAPGMAVITAMAGGGDCTYANDAPSTSYATAYVTAAAALVKEAHPYDTYEQIKYRLLVTATRSGTDSRDDNAGWGVVQPANAIMLEPGTGERGPHNPFTGTVGEPIGLASTTVTTHATVSPFDATRAFMIAAGVLVAAALAALAILATYRRRREDPPVEIEERRPGLLDVKKSDATKVLQ